MSVRPFVGRPNGDPFVKFGEIRMLRMFIFVDFRSCIVIMLIKGPRTDGPKDYWTLALAATNSNFHKSILGLVDPSILVVFASVF